MTNEFTQSDHALSTSNAKKIKLPEVLNFHNDPAHGWLAVKRQLLHDLGIANQITAYSYQRGNTVYLEEDCDMLTFFKAMEAHGFAIETVEGRFKNMYRDHTPIRSYESYRFIE